MGDEVQAKTYGFVNRQVIGLWDAGYVFYIETVWAPQDVDHLSGRGPLNENYITKKGLNQN